jgi:hypothetical protein
MVDRGRWWAKENAAGDNRIIRNKRNKRNTQGTLHAEFARVIGFIEEDH